MGKKIVICFDGTGNDFDGPSSNVLKTYRAIIKNPKLGQIAFYDPGVGTESEDTNVSVLMSFTKKKFKWIMGNAFGHGVQHNLADAYNYLMNTYHDGDKVYLFGFSRGAFTARAFAGMLNKCGLLEKRCENLIPYAIKIYNKKNNDEEAENFKNSVSRICIPHLVGVWDTVASLGKYLSKRSFSAKDLNPEIKVGLHAISIDEKRKKFPIALWSKNGASDQIIEQVWFAGVHSDIGGGYEECGLSDYSLKWMLNHAKSHELQLRPNWDEEVEPDFSEDLHKSYKRFWKILGCKDRDIQPYDDETPSVDNQVKIHDSVRLRKESKNLKKKYKPKIPDDSAINWVH